MISLAFIAVSMNASAQTKDTFILKTIPNYDQFGNLYTITKSFDHIPTSKDSADFNRESSAQMKVWMDSMYKTYYRPTINIRKKSKKN